MNKLKKLFKKWFKSEPVPFQSNWDHVDEINRQILEDQKKSLNYNPSHCECDVCFAYMLEYGVWPKNHREAME